jgi:hypothetical protein
MWRATAAGRGRERRGEDEGEGEDDRDGKAGSIAPLLTTAHLTTWAGPKHGLIATGEIEIFPISFERYPNFQRKN